MTREEACRIAALFRAYHRRVVGFAYSRVRNRDLADDIAAATWAEVARCIGTVHVADRDAFPFLATVVRSQIARHFEARRNHEHPTDLHTPTAASLLPTAPSAEDEALNRSDDGPDLPEAYATALRRLPAGQRAAVLLRCEGLTYAAAGARLGCSHTHVRNQVRRAVATLRPLLDAGELTVGAA